MALNSDEKDKEKRKKKIKRWRKRIVVVVIEAVTKVKVEIVKGGAEPKAEAKIVIDGSPDRRVLNLFLKLTSKYKA